MFKQLYGTMRPYVAALALYATACAPAMEQKNTSSADSRPQGDFMDLRSAAMKELKIKNVAFVKNSLIEKKPQFYLETGQLEQMAGVCEGTHTFYVNEEDGSVYIVGGYSRSVDNPHLFEEASAHQSLQDKVLLVADTNTNGVTTPNEFDAFEKGLLLGTMQCP